jgi:hypothetical protein
MVAAWGYSWALATTIFLLFAYQLLKLLYRITLHPLAKFPGPLLAALTFKYEFYWDGLKKGQYTRQVEKMHAKYGKEKTLEGLTDGHKALEVLTFQRAQL